MLQNAPFKKKISGKHAPEPPSKRMATPDVASPPPPKKNCWPPLANPAYAHELLLKNYLRIHPGRQLIVCSTLYVYALENLFGGQKMTKIVAQHIMKGITWALFSNTMCP